MIELHKKKVQEFAAERIRRMQQVDTRREQEERAAAERRQAEELQRAAAEQQKKEFAEKLAQEVSRWQYIPATTVAADCLRPNSTLPV